MFANFINARTSISHFAFFHVCISLVYLYLSSFSYVLAFSLSLFHTLILAFSLALKSLSREYLKFCRSIRAR